MQKQGVKFLAPGKATVDDFKAISERAMQKEDAHKFTAKTKEQAFVWLKAYPGGKK
jgi:hypothetical protein